jgi:catechol 2,3-dioxygenase-like lactoylglutathione lyase family enzyme
MPLSTTLDHVTIITDEFEASRPVYDALLATIGLRPTVDHSDPEGDEDADRDTVGAVGYSDPAGVVRLVLAAGTTPTTGAHVALLVTDAAAVISATEAATSLGVRIVQRPREWESRRLGYYGLQVADRAGNLLEIMYRD